MKRSTLKASTFAAIDNTFKKQSNSVEGSLLFLYLSKTEHRILLTEWLLLCTEIYMQMKVSNIKQNVDKFFCVVFKRVWKFVSFYSLYLYVYKVFQVWNEENKYILIIIGMESMIALDEWRV